MCKFLGWLLPLIVIVFTFWTFSWSKWLILLAALILLFREFGWLGNCNVPESKPKVKPKKK